MRSSVASLAVLSRLEAGRRLYLARWNDKWNAFSMPGGHKRDAESHRACLVRELAELDELYLPPPEDDPDEAAAVPVAGVDRHHINVRVDTEPLGRLAYEAFSQSANERTAYVVKLFAARLTSEAVAVVARNEALRWLTEAEIHAGRTDDGRRVSDTIRAHLGWLARHHVIDGDAVINLGQSPPPSRPATARGSEPLPG
jgi:hypothetical protein